jgi:hypothetical protein
MLTVLLGRMYIIVYATAALGAGNAEVLLRPAHASNLAISTTLIFPRLCPPSARRHVSRLHFTPIPISPQPTPHGLCFDALAPALRIRAACHCRGLRAPLHISGTGQGDLPLALSLVAFGTAF